MVCETRPSVQWAPTAVLLRVPCQDVKRPDVVAVCFAACVALCFAAILTTSVTRSAPVFAEQRQTLVPSAVVVLDPGHNGANASHTREINRLVDAGGFKKACNTVGTQTTAGYAEAAFNWDLAVLVAARLENAGHRVALTRKGNTGVGPCIAERAAIANRARASLQLSIHADGGPASGHGFHVIEPVLVKGYTDDIVVPSQRLAAIMIAAMTNGGFTPSTYAGQNGRSLRKDLGTLNRSDVPAVMVEVGNMRNAGDAEILSTAAGRIRLADALAAGVERFLADQPGQRPAPKV